MLSAEDDFDFYADLIEEPVARTENRLLQSTNQSNDLQVKLKSGLSSSSGTDTVRTSPSLKRKENGRPGSDEKRRKMEQSSSSPPPPPPSSVFKDKTQQLENQAHKRPDAIGEEQDFDLVFKEKYNKLLDKCKQLQQFGMAQMQRNKELERKNGIVMNNISSLYKTAKGELERKNNEITELREKLDRLLFKRKNGSAHQSKLDHHHHQHHQHHQSKSDHHRNQGSRR